MGLGGGGGLEILGKTEKYITVVGHRANERS